MVETSEARKVIRMVKAGVGVRVIGKMFADVFTNNSMSEGAGVDAFEMGLNVSTSFKQQVCPGAQTDLLLKQANGAAQA